MVPIRGICPKRWKSTSGHVFWSSKRNNSGRNSLGFKVMNSPEAPADSAVGRYYEEESGMDHTPEEKMEQRR
jgi:hypothetical protein